MRDFDAALRGPPMAVSIAADKVQRCARSVWLLGGFAMQTKIRKRSLAPIAAVALAMLFNTHGVSAATYTIEANYYLLDGKPIKSNDGGAGFESNYIAVNLPTLFAGDIINTTIVFTQGLAFRINDPGSGIQLFGATFYPNNSAGGIVSVSNQLSLILEHGDLLTPDVVTGQSHCNTCVAAGVSRNFTDSSFSFRGFSVVTTILNMPEPFGSDQMAFRAVYLGWRFTNCPWGEFFSVPARRRRRPAGAGDRRGGLLAWWRGRRA